MGHVGQHETCLRSSSNISIKKISKLLEIRWKALGAMMVLRKVMEMKEERACVVCEYFSCSLKRSTLMKTFIGRKAMLECRP